MILYPKKIHIFGGNFVGEISRNFKSY